MPMSPRRVVVLGYGMAGARLADEIRARDPEGARVTLTVVGAEAHHAYNRVLLSSVVAGSMHPDVVRLHDHGWAAEHHIDLRTDTTAVRIDRPAARGELRIDFRLGTGAARYLPGDGLKLDDGSKVHADLVVVSAGVRAETGLAQEAGLDVDRGVVVDDALRTSDGRIHAIGDCAQHPGTVSGLVEPAWQQASVLADLLTGNDISARYRGTQV